MSSRADFRFPDPWWDLRGGGQREAGQRAALAERLRLETAPGHVLFGEQAAAIGRCTACDHALFELEGGRYAIVHLSWTSNPPDQLPWPSSTVYDSWPEAEQAVIAHEPFWD